MLHEILRYDLRPCALNFSFGCWETNTPQWQIEKSPYMLKILICIIWNCRRKLNFIVILSFKRHEILCFILEANRLKIKFKWNFFSRKNHFHARLSESFTNTYKKFIFFIFCCRRWFGYYFNHCAIDKRTLFSNA